MNYNDIVAFVNKEFERLGAIDWVCYKAERTYYTQDEYECGACKMIIWFKHKNTPDDSILKQHFLSFYSLKYINNEIKNGYEPYLCYTRNRNMQLLTDLEIELRKKT